MKTTPTVCVFNRTRESFLCLSAVAAGTQRTPSLEFRFRKVAHEDGIWLMPAVRTYSVGALFPVDLVYLDRDHRVIQLVEHLDPLQIVPVQCCYASVLKARAQTIYSSRTRMGDELLICSAEEVERHWKQLQVQRSWMKQEVSACSKG